MQTRESVQNEESAHSKPFDRVLPSFCPLRLLHNNKLSLSTSPSPFLRTKTAPRMTYKRFGRPALKSLYTVIPPLTHSLPLSLALSPTVPQATNARAVPKFCLKNKSTGDKSIIYTVLQALRCSRWDPRLPYPHLWQDWVSSHRLDFSPLPH